MWLIAFLGFAVTFGLLALLKSKRGELAADDWRMSLGEDVRNHPSLGVFKPENMVSVPSAVVKSLVDAQKLIGKDKIPVPGENATAEDWGVVFDRLGRPKTFDEYEIPTDLKAPEGFPEVNPEIIKAFKTKAHEIGLLPAQVKEIFKWYMDSSFNEFNQGVEEGNRVISEAETKLRSKWGKAYDQNVVLAKRIVTLYGGENAKDLLEKTGLGNDVRAIELFANIGKKMSEDGLLKGEVVSTKSPEEAQAEIRKIQGDTKHPFHIRDHPEHKMAVDYMQTLYEQAHPEKA